MPRSMAGKAAAQIGPARPQVADRLADEAAVLRPAERGDDLGDAEQADGDRHEADAVAELGEAHGHARRRRC